MGTRLAAAVRRALKEVPPSTVDAGAVELALTYARALDDGEDLAKIGPLLLAVLESLHMTTRARAVKGGSGGVDVPKPSPADQLRARREARVTGT